VLPGPGVELSIAMEMSERRHRRMATNLPSGGALAGITQGLAEPLSMV
jgi:hypothetical protein